jgi:RNA polymerase sigma factor (sigma-70 family)
MTQRSDANDLAVDQAFRRAPCGAAHRLYLQAVTAHGNRSDIACNAGSELGVSDVEVARAARGWQGVPNLEFTEFFQAAFPDLVRGLFLLTADRDEAEELAQEAMARVYVRWDRVSKMSSPGGYVYRTAVNLNRKRLRRLAIRARKALFAGQEPHGSPVAESTLDLAAALGALRPKQQEAFLLVEWVGLSAAEAGRILGIKPPSVRSRVHRARAALREALGEDVESRG